MSNHIPAVRLLLRFACDTQAGCQSAPRSLSALAPLTLAALACFLFPRAEQLKYCRELLAKEDRERTHSSFVPLSAFPLLVRTSARVAWSGCAWLSTVCYALTHALPGFAPAHNLKLSDGCGRLLVFANADKGLADRVAFEFVDYRVFAASNKQRFNRIVSCEMLEAVCANLLGCCLNRRSAVPRFLPADAREVPRPLARSLPLVAGSPLRAPRRLRLCAMFSCLSPEM